MKTLKTLLGVAIIVIVLGTAIAKPHGIEEVLEIFLLGDEHDEEWGYGETNGPDTWHNTYPMCGGSRQSPVAIVTDEALQNTTWEPLQFINYDIVPLAMTVTNTGHTVQVDMQNNAAVLGGDLAEPYAFAQFHFHWGATDTRGSEHTVDGLSYTAEVHMVHYMASFGSMDEALNYEKGVAVLGITMEVSPQDNPDLEPIINALEQITFPGDIVPATPIPLFYLLPNNKEQYFRYEGSLTTPGCDEAVVWTIFKETLPISTGQLEQFRQLVGSDGEPLQDNFRNPQPLSGRQVYKTWQ